MAGKRCASGRVAGFYSEEDRGLRRRLDEVNEKELEDIENQQVLGDNNGVYEVERIVEMKKRKVLNPSDTLL